jgi:hypothetical protein
MWWAPSGVFTKAVPFVPERVSRRPSASRNSRAQGRRGVEAQRQRAAAQLGDAAVGVHFGGRAGARARQGEVGSTVGPAGVVGDAYADDAFGGREAFDGDQRRVERVAARPDAADGGVGGEPVAAGLQIAYFGGVRGVDALAHQPEAVGELHGGPRKGEWKYGRRNPEGSRAEALAPPIYEVARDEVNALDGTDRSASP